MKRWLSTLVGLLALGGLMGCSGGSSPAVDPTPTPSPTPATDTRTALQKLLSGSSPTGSKRWTFRTIKGISSYTFAGDTGQAEPCPKIYSWPGLFPEGSGSQGKILQVSCWPTDYIEFRADGKARVGSTGDPTPDDFTLSWSLTETESEATLAGPLRATLDGAVTGTFRLAQIPTSGFTKSVRLTVLSANYPGTDPRHPSTAGFEFVLEGPGT